jgi:hypothetical protein
VHVSPAGFTRPSEQRPVGGKVVGVIEKFEWSGGLSDPLRFDFYVSQQNAHEIKALQQQALRTTKVKSLGWWIADYDLETKGWFEQANPIGRPAVSGMLAGKETPQLDVNLNPVHVGTDAIVYKVTMSVAPAANMTYSLHFADSSKKQVVKTWGGVVGTPGRRV